MTRLVKLSAALLACLVLVVPAINAQAPCTMQTITGTYVMYEKGNALAINLTPQPAPPTWTATAIAPFVNISQITFTPEGVGAGFYWIFAGSFKPALDPIPLTITVTELLPDCTGTVEYTAELPGAPAPVSIRERFVVTDNGKEIHTVPTSIVNGVPTQAWLGKAYRIKKGSAPVDSCGPQTATGAYLLRCENIVRSPLNPNMAVADAMLLRLNIAMSGDYDGLLFEKMGPVSIDKHPINGSFTVNPNCSFTGTFIADGVPGVVMEKGIFFDEGKQLYAMAILNSERPPEQQGMKYSFCEGKRIAE